jgi:Flp pilus assembly protein CpaB
MEAQSPRSRIGGGWTDQLLSSRRGALLIAAVAAAAAGVLIFLFVQHYKKSNTTPVVAAPTNEFVFVSSQFIPKGTAASLIAQEGLLRRTEVASNQVVAGAVTDPSVIAGEVSSTSIAAGQQVTIGDFTRSAVSIGAYLTGDQRAIALQLDATHGLTTYLTAGNTVDVAVDKAGVMTVLAQNVPVLENQSGLIVVRVSDKLALQLAGAADNDKIWLTLRPNTGATSSVKVGAKAVS